MRPRGMSLPDLVRMFSVEESGGCIVWTGQIRKDGYGTAMYEGEKRLAHRLAWEAVYGKLASPSVTLDHVCHNEAAARGECDGGSCRHRRCVNPEHLNPCSLGDNIKASPLYWAAKKKAGLTNRGPKGGGSTHGTRSNYVNNGCRCGECREASNKYARERHARLLEAAAS